MKKICYITTITGTLTTFVNETATYLHENQGWDITYISAYKKETVSKIPKCIHYIPVDMARGMNLKGFKATLQLIKIFKEQKFDMVQYATPNAALYASIAAKIARVPVRLYCQWGYVFVAFTGIKRQIFKMIERIIAMNSTHIQVISPSNRELGIKEKLFSEKKSSVLWNGSAAGVRLDKFDITKKDEYRKEIREKHGIPQDAFAFGFVGRITRDKGVNEVIGAFKNLYAKNKDLYLFIVGLYDKPQTLDQELIKWAIDCDHVIMPGISHEIEKYFSAMDCFVLPTYREGFGEVVIEAATMALPTITTNVPGPKDSVVNGETGILIESKSTSAVENAMEMLYNDKELCEKLSKNCRDFAVKNFNREVFLEKLVEDRKKLLNIK